jgi:hypothetical protein
MQYDAINRYVAHWAFCLRFPRVPSGKTAMDCMLSDVPVNWGLVAGWMCQYKNQLGKLSAKNQWVHLPLFIYLFMRVLSCVRD